MHESRLLGTWRSDARRTKRELAARRDISPADRRMLGRLFGKLELRYTRSRCFATLDGRTESGPYTVVARDDTSVAIVALDPLTGKDVIFHLHFDGPRFWVNVGNGMFREYFARKRSGGTRR